MATYVRERWSNANTVTKIAIFNKIILETALYLLYVHLIYLLFFFFTILQQL